jgi:hypothetical protein
MRVRELVKVAGGFQQMAALTRLVAGRVGDVAALLLAEVVQRAVERGQQMAALPEADPEDDDQCRRGDDQPAAELVEMIDDAQPVLMTDRSQALRHRAATDELLGAALGAALGGRSRLRVLRLL